MSTFYLIDSQALLLKIVIQSSYLVNILVQNKKFQYMLGAKQPLSLS